MLEAIRNKLPERLSRFQNLEKVLENTGWLFADKVLRALVGFLVGAWFARVLGPDQYGVYNYAFAVIVVLSPLVTLGIDEILIRDLIQKPERRDALLGSALGLKLLGGAALVGLTAAYGYSFHRHDSLVLWLMIIFGVGTLARSMEVGDLWFQSQIESKSSILPRMFAMGVFTALKVWALFSSNPIIYFACFWSLEMAFGGALTLFYFRKKAGQLRTWRIEPKLMLEFVAQGWPLMLAAVLINMHMRLDQILLKWMVGDHELGIYSAAVKLIEVWYFVPIVLSAGLYPSVVKSKAVSHREYEGRVQALYDLVIWLGLSFAVLMQFLSPWVVKILLGSQFAGSVPILEIYCWLGLSIFFMQARLRWLAIEGQLRAMLWVEAITVIANGALNWIMIPRWGALGAAWAALGSALFGNLVTATFSAPIRKSLGMYARSLILPFRLFQMARAGSES